jgi:hypothetical protein
MEELQSLNWVWVKSQHKRKEKGDDLILEDLKMMTDMISVPNTIWDL